MTKYIILGIAGTLAVIGIATFVLSKLKKDDTQAPNTLKKTDINDDIGDRDDVPSVKAQNHSTVVENNEHIIDAPKEQNNNDNTDVSTKSEVDADIKDVAFSTMSERHNMAAELIKQTVKEMDSDITPESQNDEDFDNMLNDVDALSDKE